jgi:hypothetical protein
LHLVRADVTPFPDLPVDDVIGAREVTSVEKSGESSRNVVDCSNTSYCVSEFCEANVTDIVVAEIWVA